MPLPAAAGGGEEGAEGEEGVDGGFRERSVSAEPCTKTLWTSTVAS
jgi:hypothetical protein